MHGKVRLCVERCRHSWSCSVKRLWSSGAERARAPMSSAPAEPSGLDLGNIGKCGVFEQPGRAISSGLAEPSKFQRHFSSAPAKPSGLEPTSASSGVNLAWFAPLVCARVFLNQFVLLSTCDLPHRFSCSSRVSQSWAR